MTFLLFVLCFQDPTSLLQFVEPVDSDFSGKTVFRLESSVPEDDLIGIELFISGRSVHYFDGPPFEVELNMSAYPEGKLNIEAVLERFDADKFTTTFSGNNHPFVEEQNVQLVQVPVTVENGRSVGLTAADFQLLEDGLDQKVVRVYNETGPMQLVVLLDVSGSMERNLPMLRRSLTTLLDSLKPGDRVQVIGFNHGVFEVCPSEENLEEVQARLYNLKAEGSTNLYGALWSGIKATSKTNQRRALIVFTDGDHDLNGQEDPYKKSFQDCIDLAREHGIPVFAMGMGIGVKPGLLEELAEATGGRSFLFHSMKAAKGSFAEIGEELRRQYLVCYYTNAQKSGWHQLEIKARDQQMLRYSSKIFFRQVGM